MKTTFGSFLSTLPRAPRLVLILYALGFPLGWLGEHFRTFDFYYWLALAPSRVWHGEVWRLMTYASLANGIVDWVVSLFWLGTLLSVLGRHWSGGEVLVYCLLTTVAGALPVIAFAPSWIHVVGNAAMIFGLLAAWYRLYGRERLILLGFGELSVRQAAILVAGIEFLVQLFCLGWLVTLAMLGGGVAGWIYLALRNKHAYNRQGQLVESERIARLEL